MVSVQAKLEWKAKLCEQCLEQPEGQVAEADARQVVPKKPLNSFQYFYKSLECQNQLEDKEGKEKLKAAGALWKDLARAISFSKDAYKVLGVCMEHMLELFFHRGHLVASHCRRKSLKKEDLALGQVLSCEDKVQRSLTECQEKMRSEALHLEKTLRQQKKRQIRDVQAPKTPPSAKRARSPME